MGEARGQKERKKAVKVKWENEVFLFFEKQKQSAMWWEAGNTECRGHHPAHPSHHRIFSSRFDFNSPSLCPFSALSWLFIFLVIPKNYFIIFFLPCPVLYVGFGKEIFFRELQKGDVYRRMYLLVSRISLLLGKTFFVVSDSLLDRRQKCGEKGDTSRAGFCAGSHFLLKVGEKKKQNWKAKN